MSNEDSGEFDRDELSQSINMSLTGISRVVSESIYTAQSRIEDPSRDAPSAEELSSISHTMTGVRIAPSIDGRKQDIEFNFNGPEAPVLARPIDAIVHATLWNSKRRGQGATDRTITASGTQDQIDHVNDDLQEFARVMMTPQAQQKLLDAQLLCLKLEKAAPCKVFMKFDYRDGDLGVDFTTVTTEDPSAQATPKSEERPKRSIRGLLGKAFTGTGAIARKGDEPVQIANSFIGRSGVTTKAAGSWRTSDMVDRRNGIDVKFDTSREGQTSFLDGAEKILGEPVPESLRNALNPRLAAPTPPALEGESQDLG